MKHILLLAAAGVALLLVGCDKSQETPQQRDQRVGGNLDLPPGCVFHFAGYASGDPIYLVRCDGAVTTTTNTTWRSGKTSHHDATVSYSSAKI